MVPDNFFLLMKWFLTPFSAWCYAPLKSRPAQRPFAHIRSAAWLPPVARSPHLKASLRMIG
jgi:hypothetical protein